MENSAAEPAQPSPPVACSLGAGDLSTRVARWRDLAGQADLRMSRTDRGVRLSFSGQPGVAGEASALAALERDCCAFAEWTVSMTGDRVVVDICAADEDARAAVRGMLADLAGVADLAEG